MEKNITCIGVKCYNHDTHEIYEKDFNPNKIKGKHIAPHTIEMAAMWAVLTRLEQPKKANISLNNLGIPVIDKYGEIFTNNANFDDFLKKLIQ